jgi:hypothetical protein
VAEGKEEYQVKISNSFAALENLHDDMGIEDLGNGLKGSLQFQPKRVIVVRNRNRISHGSTKDGQNSLTEGNKLKCSGYRIRAKLMEAIRTTQDVKPESKLCRNKGGNF